MLGAMCDLKRPYSAERVVFLCLSTTHVCELFSKVRNIGKALRILSVFEAGKLEHPV